MKLKNAIKPIMKVVTPKKRTSKDIILLSWLLKFMSFCGISQSKVKIDGEEISIRVSMMLKLYCWSLFMIIAISTETLLLLHNPWIGGSSNIPIYFICFLFDMFLYHMAIASAICSVTSVEMKGFIDILKWVDEKTGAVGTWAPSGKRAVIFLVLHVLGSLIDLWIHLTEASGTQSGLHLIIISMITLRYIILEVFFLYLCLLPTIRMRAIQKRMLEITKSLGVTKIEDYWLNASMSNIFTVNHDVSRSPKLVDSLFHYIRLQESTRGAARKVESVMGLSVLMTVIFCFGKVFFGILYGVRAAVDTDLYSTLLATGRLITYFSMLIALSEASHDFYSADAHVTRSLVDATCAYTHRARGSLDARAQQLWSRLRVAVSRSPAYTAFRLLTINREMLSSVAQTALTYSIMLLQLKSGLQVEPIFP